MAKRLPKGTSNIDAADFYAKCSISQMEEDNWRDSEVYAEWARIEYEKAGFSDSAKKWAKYI